jgi:hypothetical protein
VTIQSFVELVLNILFLVTTTEIRAVPDNQIKARASERTNHQRPRMPSSVGSATKKVTRKLIAGPD